MQLTPGDHAMTTKTAPAKAPSDALLLEIADQAFPQHRDAGDPEQRPARLPRCGGLGDPRRAGSGLRRWASPPLTKR